ncbi:MAG: hypothetical protein IGS39_01835 [Calothrix sp. C42_A2020_038]|nr:hypothetical protein [Calothrix sp. C42_A2020_038]
MWQYILAWFPMILIAIFNAGIRESIYAKYFSELRAHQVSTLTGIILFGLYIWVLTNAWPIQSTTQAVTIGLIWLGLTIAFEFLFGYYVMGHEWSQLLADYNLLAGRIWIFVLIWIAIAPFIFYYFHNQI